MTTIISACNNQQGEVKAMRDGTPALSASTITAMKVVKEGRVFFAHKSVGDNIMNGLKTVADESAIKLNIRVLNHESLSDDSGLFAHAQNGENGNPVSKVDSFHATVMAFNAFTPQIAFMKFCYVDFEPDSDVKELFSHYKNRLESLTHERPGITFIHLTVPLSTRLHSWKNRIKRFVGMQTWDDGSNIKRAEFNHLLRQSFPKEQVFDIARIESTRPDGSREGFGMDNNRYESMVPAYASDDGHLNSYGQHLMAQEMVCFLATVLKERDTNR